MKEPRNCALSSNTIFPGSARTSDVDVERRVPDAVGVDVEERRRVDGHETQPVSRRRRARPVHDGAAERAPWQRDVETSASRNRDNMPLKEEQED